MKSLLKSAAIVAALFSVNALSTAVAGPKMAIIIDDLGFAKWPVERAVNLPSYVTLAVFPSLPLSRSTAEQAHAKGHEVIVHLPMQPRGDAKINPGTLTTTMGEDAYLTQMMQHLQSVPYAVGASNHMGSAVTADSNAMTLTMSTLKSWGNLYFVDSRTTGDTVAQSTAEQMGVPVTRRDVFIDNDQSVAAIRKALLSAVDKAKKTGFAVAVGHPTANTLSVLEEEMPLIRAEGIELVPVSVLIAARNGAQSGGVQLSATASTQAAEQAAEKARMAAAAKAQVAADARAAEKAAKAKAQKIADAKAARAASQKRIARKLSANSTPSPDFESAAQISAENRVYSDTGSSKAFLENIPLAKTYPSDAPAPGE